MISTSYDIKEFFREIGGMHQLDAIQMAHQEATMVERLMLSNKCAEDENEDFNPDCANYSKTLKEFIRYVRYCAKPKILDHTKTQLFDAYLKSISTKKEHRRT